jgi:hypothetical protein
MIRVWNDSMPLWENKSESIGLIKTNFYANSHLDVTLWSFALYSKGNRTQSALFVHSIRKQPKGAGYSKITHLDELHKELLKELQSLFIDGMSRQLLNIYKQESISIGLSIFQSMG